MTERSSGTGRSRRWVLTSTGLAVAAAAVPSAMAANTAFASTAELPAVDMEMLLVAAQVDPPKDDTEVTPGAKEHVIAVEKALKDQKLLGKDDIDGHFGSKTVAAYTKWQEKLEYSGLDANGMPGKTSLEKLGKDKFTLKQAFSGGSRNNSYAGQRTNTRTVKMLQEAAKDCDFDLVLSQGSYTDSNPGSAGTHDGGGTVDISIEGLTNKQIWGMVKVLRTVGFAAWLRNPDQGFDYHVHAVAVADPDLSSNAQAQVGDYFLGKNGLSDHGPDDTPESHRVDFTWWEKYKRG